MRNTFNTAYNVRLDIVEDPTLISKEDGAMFLNNGGVYFFTGGQFYKLSGSTEAVFVSAKTDFPEAVGGVITLADYTTYFLTKEIDLNGDRIICGQNNVILGFSSENCSLTSTGLTGQYLIYSDYTLAMRHLTIKNVDLGVGINTLDAGAQPIALDWTGVNFSGCNTNLFCGDIDNFIFSKGAILGSGTIVFDGQTGTVGFDNSIFVGSGSAYSMLDLTANSVITRRFRVAYSSFVAFGSTVGINVHVDSTIPVDSYILDTINFSGGGTYLTGVDNSYDYNEPRFLECRGIVNTTAVGNYYMNNNLTETTILATSTPVKISGTTSPAPINQKFTHTDDRLTYIGALNGDFQISANISMASGNNQELGAWIYKNGIQVVESEMYSTTSGVGKGENISVQCILNLVSGDYIEMWVENRTAIQNITVEHLNLICKEI